MEDVLKAALIIAELAVPWLEENVISGNRHGELRASIDKILAEGSPATVDPVQEGLREFTERTYDHPKMGISLRVPKDLAGPENAVKLREAVDSMLATISDPFFPF